ncbi:MAG: hypothetical protein K0Q49_157 [Haloplasmataceae bacterium]|jgi:predicted MFS family arabinose efflux permease|nr:hypothetical protein [Haloplasmataceae bacterium]
MEIKNYKQSLFCTVTILFWFSTYAYVPIFTNYLNSLGASSKMVGLIAGSYGFTQMILRIPLGILSDKIQRRKLFIILGLLFTLISGAGLLFTRNNLYLILLFRAIAGVAASTWVSFTVLYTSYYNKSHTSKAIGTINFFNNTGQMLAMLIGGLAVQLFSWHASFTLSTISGLIGLLLSFFIIENNDENKEKITLKGVLSVISNHKLILATLFAIIAQMITFATAFSFTTKHAINIGVTNFELGILSFASTLPTAIAALIGGRYLGQKFGEKRMIIIGFILLGIFTLVIPFTNTFTSLLITQFISGIGRGLSFPLLMSLSIKDINPNKQSTAMGIFQALYGIGMTIGPIIMGYLIDNISLMVGFVSFGLLGCITSLMFYLTTKKI